MKSIKNSLDPISKVLDAELTKSLEVQKKEVSSLALKKGGVSELSFSQQKIKNELSDFLKISIELKSNANGKGKLTIPFASEKELERIIELFGL